MGFCKIQLAERGGEIMSDWFRLNQYRVKAPTAAISQRYCTTDDFGFCGMFRFTLDDKMIRCMASDGAGWRHVSVSVENDRRCPTWQIMCKVKDLFWDDTD